MAARKSLSDLCIDYFDLYLVHFPIALKVRAMDLGCSGRFNWR